MVRQPDDPAPDDPRCNLHSRLRYHRAMAQGAVHQLAPVGAARLRQRIVYGFRNGARPLRYRIHPSGLFGADPGLQRVTNWRGGDVARSAAARDFPAGAVRYEADRSAPDGRVRAHIVRHQLLDEFVSDAPLGGRTIALVAAGPGGGTA